jgi:hypothetical protein
VVEVSAREAIVRVDLADERSIHVKLRKMSRSFVLRREKFFRDGNLPRASLTRKLRCSANATRVSHARISLTQVCARRRALNIAHSRMQGRRHSARQIPSVLHVRRAQENSRATRDAATASRAMKCANARAQESVYGAAKSLAQAT